jgi:hypothetical protein
MKKIGCSKELGGWQIFSVQISALVFRFLKTWGKVNKRCDLQGQKKYLYISFTYMFVKRKHINERVREPVS